jgi:hypothetical protein
MSDGEYEQDEPYEAYNEEDAGEGEGEGSGDDENDGADAHAEGMSVSAALKKEGFLHKQGNFNSGWQRRWFAFRDGALKYYKSMGVRFFACSLYALGSAGGDFRSRVCTH